MSDDDHEAELAFIESDAFTESMLRGLAQAFSGQARRRDDLLEDDSES